MVRSSLRSKTTCLLIAAWGINIVALLALLAGIVLYLSRQPVQAALPAAAPASPTEEEAPPASPIPPPRILHLPTVTPNPNSTPVEAGTPTPFYLPSGRRAAVIGLSVSGRALELFTFGKGERQRMIVAGIHGGYEWNTIALADELIAWLDEHPEAVPADLTLYILRNLNPDGAARGHGPEGRANDHGVDLNRNFPVNWEADWPRDGCWTDTVVTGGAYPGSEPEARSLIRFLEAHPVDALISYHSAALGVFPGGTPWDKDSKRLAKAIAGITGYSYPPVDTGCHFTGTLADYAVSLGAAAVDMELSDHVHTDFERNLEVLLMFMGWER